MSRVWVYPFTQRAVLFTTMARDSYVGPRVFPRLAVLYAVLIDGGNTEHYDALLDEIQSYVEDRFYDDMLTSGVYEDDLQLPKELLARSVKEILQAAELLDDVGADVSLDLSCDIHRCNATFDALRNEFVVRRR